MLGLEPTPNKNIIVLNVTDERSISTISVEETGWEVLATTSVDESSAIDEAVKSIAEPAMEWAETYYSSESFAVF